MRHIVLNRNGKLSLYKRALHEVLKTEGDKLILGYGYLRDDVIKRKEFVENLKAGFSTSTKKEIIIIGGKEDSYVTFLEAAKFLKNEIQDADIRVLIKRKKKYRQYHKKLAVKLKGDEPVLALLGSSNLSSATYDDLPYNQEVDILLWNSFIIDNALEKKILNNVNKIKWQEKFEKLREIDRFFNFFNIDLGLEFELEDIIDEITNYKLNDFDLKYISEASLSSISEEEVKHIINDGSDIEIIKESLLYLYNYTKINLNNPDNYCYFNLYYQQYKNIIDHLNKIDILNELNTSSEKIIFTLKMNRVRGESVFLLQKLINILS